MSDNWTTNGSRNFRGALRSSSFKEALVRFFITIWGDAHPHVIGSKVIYATSEERCFSYRSEHDKVIKTEEETMQNYFEEADSKLLFHVKSVPAPANVVIRMRDSDVFVIALGVFHMMQADLNLWFEVGLFSDNSLRYISVNQIYEALGIKVCNALPAFHAFTGSDYSAAFSGKGKELPLKKLQRSEETLDVFASLGTSEFVTEHAVAIIERFTCHLYGKPITNTVNEARLECFVGKYKGTSKTQTLNKP